jgi:hypothetical protein
MSSHGAKAWIYIVFARAALSEAPSVTRKDRSNMQSQLQNKVRNITCSKMCSSRTVPAAWLPRCRLQRPCIVLATPDGDKNQQQEQGEDKKPDRGSGTLSNRFEKMLEELQKAGLTPAKAKVCGVGATAPHCAR